MTIQHLPKSVSPRRVVILGGSGFVGRHLAQHLDSLSVPVVSLNSTDLDLTDRTAHQRLSQILRDDDSLVVSAAITPEKGNDLHSLMCNLIMAQQCCSIVEPRIAHLVYISSDAVFGSTTSFIRDDSLPTPTSYYAHMHFVREHIFATATRRWACPFLVLRPTAIYGPGDTHLSYGPNRFVRTAVGDRRITLFGNGEELRDHIFVSDVVRVIGLCLFRRSTGSLNLATGRSLSFAHLADHVVTSIPHAVSVSFQPRHSPVTHRHFDISEIILAFPTLRFTDIDVGLRITINSLFSIPQPV